MGSFSRIDGAALVTLAALESFPAARIEVRQSVAGKVIGALVAALIAAGSVYWAFWMVEERTWPVWMATGWVGGFGFLFVWLYLRDALASREPHGWVLREDGAHLLVNLRSHLNLHVSADIPCVLVIPRHRVRSLKLIREGGVRSFIDSDGDLESSKIRRNFLDVLFDGGSLDLPAAVAAEHSRWGDAPFGKSRVSHSAVRCLDQGTLRIAWHDETNRLRPPLDDLRRTLSMHYRFATARSEPQLPIQELGRADQEARLLEMLERGERLEAVKLAKVLYKLNTTDAVRFVESLDK